MEAGQLGNYTYFFLLVMIRYTGIFLITPVLGSRVIPGRVKIAVSFFMALVTVPILNRMEMVLFPARNVEILLTVMRELAVGLTIGLLTYLVFAAFQLAGQFIDLRMGFRMANIVDPMRGTSSPLVGQLKNVLATLVFLSLNGHHILIEGLHRSFAIIPPGGMSVSSGFWELLFRRSADVFIIAFKVALPIMGTIFIADIIFAFLARSIPQMNIFIVGFPVKIFVGILFLVLSIHIIINFYDSRFQQLFRDIINLIRLLGP
ncbi:MAG: flagellar biosynthetic protein FliR [Bacillota bacterium]